MPKLKLKLLIPLLLFAQIYSIYPDEYSTGTGGGYTDQDQHTINTYVHQGKVQREMEEACNQSDDAKRACDGQKAYAINASVDMSVEIIAKLYAMMMPMAGGSSPALKAKSVQPASTPTNATAAPPATATGTTAPATPQTAQAPAAAKEKKDVKDFCQYIPMASEGAATIFLTTMNESDKISPNNTEAIAQREALLQTAKSHHNRKKTAQLQTVGWGATATCYVGMVAYGWSTSGLSVPLMTYVKLAAASALGYFYLKQAKAHGEYESEVKHIANSLPGVGDCNPVTDRTCYCLQPETQNDAQYCSPAALRARGGQNRATLIACTDSKMESDPNCNCLQTNSCFDKTVANLATAMNVGFSTDSAPFNDVNNIYRGELTQGADVEGNIKKQMAMTNQIFAKMDEETKKEWPKPSGSEKEGQYAKALLDMGLPVSLAPLLDKAPLDQNIFNKIKGHSNSFSEGKNLLSKYQGQQGMRNLSDQNLYGKTGLQRSPSNYNNNNQGSKTGKPEKSQADSQVLDFAAKSINKADVQKDNGRNIFEVISHRYRQSAMSRLAE